ncbi:MAG: TIGR00730 family Rossman fold protein [Alphaproteobacteria bacterium]|nr:TIGR00730 family Rossman fold protein [Alphaproteobacteria bacterium]
MAVINRICVYCGAAGDVDESYRAAAIRMGSLLAENRIGLVYGGGRVGLMGLMADTALAYGGEVVGIIPGHLHDREIGHTGLTRLMVVGSMHERKQTMFELADAFAILPGGFGTLEEALECITWRQLGLHDKPIFLIDVQDYWVPLLRLFEHVIDSGFAPLSTRTLFQVLPRVEELPAALAAAPQPTTPAKSGLV